MTELNTKLLEQTAALMVMPGKGILAADESNETADKRLADIGVDGSSEMRRQYRQLFLGAAEIENYVSGVILYDETFYQKSDSGETFPEMLALRGILPGIKVDQGAKDSSELPGEKLTVGLDGLEGRAAKYFQAGARFAKWRVIFTIDENKNFPSKKSIEKNAAAMAEYVMICQKVGLVPIVEPEVLLQGEHSIEKAEEVTTKVVKEVLQTVEKAGAFLPGLVLKTSMVINGNQNADEASPEEVAEATVRMLSAAVPKNIGGVVFLSGGQTAVEASAHLDAIAEQEPLPFEVAFSYGRALQGPALRIWRGKKENIDVARQEFLKRLRLNQMADAGGYDVAFEFLD
jgi:fructose-bisphosphate aldolase class I